MDFVQGNISPKLEEAPALKNTADHSLFSIVERQKNRKEIAFSSNIFF